MLTNHTIIRIIREVGLIHRHPVDLQSLLPVEMNVRTFQPAELPEFERDLVEAGNPSRILFLRKTIPSGTLHEFLKDQRGPVITFLQGESGLTPLMWTTEKGRTRGTRVDAESPEMSLNDSIGNQLARDDQGQLICLTCVIYDNPFGGNTESEGLRPVSRLLRLLNTERKEIFYILFYALLVGLVSLALPLGIQTTVELISGGVFFSSVYLMIALVIVGVLVGGALQVIQITMVDYLQRRVFTKAAFEFAYRIPRLRLEALSTWHAPELVNRFFDVITIQKGLPKLLIDLSSAGIQIIFGLLLISLYHPFFILFGLLLVSLLAGIFYATGPRGLRSSINESKYKYRVVHWLEELARAIQSFKLGGTTDLPIRKTDHYVNGYLNFRRIHFNTLVTQFGFVVLFKAAIVGGLLIVGTMLVVDREITLGQLVASEIVIILIVNSVEKIIMYMDVIYDLLTAVDKIAHVTDLPIERAGGLDIPSENQQGFAVKIKNLSYVVPDGDFQLHDINLSIAPGERICIAGPGGSGKTILTNLLSGLYTDFKGSITLDGYSMRDLDLTHLRERIAKNISADDLFDGTLFENLSVGNARTSIENVMAGLRSVQLDDWVNSTPQGLRTQVLSGGKGFPSSVIQKLILARCISKQPKLMVLNDFFIGLPQSEKLQLIHQLMGTNNRWTFITVSNDPLVMAACDRVVVLNEGRMQAEGTFSELIKSTELKTLID